MKSIILIFILLNSTYVSSQSDCDCYERLESLAKLKSFEGEHNEALATYKTALSFLPASARNYMHDLNLSLFYLEDAQHDSAFYYLIKSIEGGYPNGALEYDVRFDALQETDYWKQIQEAYRKPSEVFHWDLYNSIQGLRAIDQSVRMRGGGLGVLADDSLSMMHLFTTVDSIVFEAVVELIKAHGYPSQVTHGFNESYMLFFLHSSMYSEEKYELIREHVKKQNEMCLCKKGELALLADRRLDWIYKKKQVAGTWNYPGEFLPIEDLEKVDSIRFQHNLLNLRDWGRMTGRSRPEEYKPMDYPENYFCE